MDWQTNIARRIIIDNGSHRIRYGTAAHQDPLKECLNLVAQFRKTGQFMYGNDLDALMDENQIIHYIKPVIRGVLVNIDREISLWERFMSKEMEGNSLTLTYQPFTPESSLSKMCEIAFEYFGFDAFSPVLSQAMVANGKFSLVVDSSHCATHIVPIFDGEVMDGFVRRIEIGGRLLTNQLKELISLKQFEFKHYLLLANQIKEEVCYVSMDFRKDIKLKNGALAKSFILPDYDVGIKGYAQDTQLAQGLMNQRVDFDKERIKIPEILFTPSDIGQNQKGPVSTIQEIVSSMHPDLGGYFLENIILTGGNTLFKNFAERFTQDLRCEIDQAYDIKVNHLNEINSVFKGCQQHTRSADFVQKAITKRQFSEYGFSQIFQMYM